MSVCASVRLSVRMEHLGSHWTDFHEIWHLRFLETLSRKFKLFENLTRIMGTSYENMYTFMHTYILSEFCLK